MMPEPADVRPPLGDDVLWVPQIACEILGVTTDQLIDLVRARQLVARRVDDMLMFREGDLYALANIRTARSTTSSDLPATRRAALLDMADRYEASRHPTLKPGTTGYAWLTDIADMCRERAQDYPEGEPDIEADRLRVELALIREGADSATPDPGTQRTTAQVWAWLLALDPPTRAETLSQILAQARDGFTCHVQGHAGYPDERQCTARALAAALDEASVLREELAKATVDREAAQSPVAGGRAADPGDLSDGHHTFSDLYAHRAALFAALCRSYPGLSWRSRQHHEGGDPMFPGFFIAGVRIPSDGAGYDQISYHHPLDVWDWFDGVTELDHAPEWDGHTPAQVIDRLNSWEIHSD